jgi:MOSC domain-containing protein YiiM
VSAGRIVAICISAGGIPKLPVDRARVEVNGLAGDGHAHAKHNRVSRAVSLFDDEILEELRARGYRLVPGSIGENLTVRGLHVQTLAPGTRLVSERGVVLELSEQRKPCYVLDAIDVKLKDVIVGRCGFLASVITPGELFSGDLLSSCS